ncbi:hypothetical protein [Romboutsia sp.]|uniref:hypothetical protein n=1 Tax=Romboutsia sp. TaxID=1965302 RepID=UPI003F40BD77
MANSVNLDEFDFTEANILLSSVNSPAISKYSAIFKLFSIYYYKNIKDEESTVNINIIAPIENGIDSGNYIDSINVAILYDEFIHGYMTSIYLPSHGFLGAILNRKNAPLQVQIL